MANYMQLLSPLLFRQDLREALQALHTVYFLFQPNQSIMQQYRMLCRKNPGIQKLIAPQNYPVHTLDF